MKPALTLSGGEMGGGEGGGDWREGRGERKRMWEGGGRESKSAQCRQKVFSYEERK